MWKTGAACSCPCPSTRQDVTLCMMRCGLHDRHRPLVTRGAQTSDVHAWRLAGREGDQVPLVCSRRMSELGCEWRAEQQE